MPTMTYDSKKTPQPPPDTPWAVHEVKKTVRTQDGARKTVTRVEHRIRPRPTPWAPPEPPPSPPPAETPPAEKTQPQPHERKKRVAPASPRTRQVSASNYAAVEAGAGEYGIIDLGEAIQGGGDRSVLVHVPKRIKAPWRVLSQIRPGSTLSVKTGPGKAGHALRVRFTTPARYYSPGTKISTLVVGVDGTDWNALTAITSGI